MKIYMTDSTFRYDIEALAKAIFKTENLEPTRDHDACGPLLAIFHSEEGDCLNVKVLWRDRENRIFEKHEAVKLFSKDERENRKQVRRRLKFLIVKTVLGENSGIVLPWGTLTGIKPSKLVHEMIKNGMKPELVRLKLKNVITEKLPRSSGYSIHKKKHRVWCFGTRPDGASIRPSSSTCERRSKRTVIRRSGPLS
jgi:oxygen-independent coproporphyrinogen-3 oxidase